ncbi:MAG: hypothetical protein E6R12_14220 [Sphingomonadales bacterium]|nr:MAG: hypothetical protein E6R12_14220 [Sphingomonadales bacterium]
MGAWFICRSGEPAATSAKLAAARAQFRRHGLPEPVDFATPTHQGFFSGPVHAGLPTHVQRGGDFVAVAGTLFYKGQGGEAALLQLLDDFTFPFERWSDCIGQFALLVCKDGVLHVATDYFAAFQVFHDAARDIVSTSMLATVACLPRVRFSPQGVYEFVFSAFPMGDETVFEEMKRLGPHEQLRLGDQVSFAATPKHLPDAFDDRPIESMVREHADRVLALAGVAVKLFGDNIQCPLSAGYDSRMALGALRAQGSKPYVYVYGSPGDPDVELACAIGKGEGFAVNLFQKSSWKMITPAEFPAVVAENFEETDGLVTDGGLFDNGGNRRARLDRQAGGALAVSGGCGEVFRNFFYLPDGRYTTRDILYAFFSQFDAADCTSEFDPHRYYMILSAKLKAAIRTTNDTLTRQQVEKIYPAFRCRPFFGREISLVGRHGAYFMPFLETDLVRAALQIPLRYKTFGQFQARLIAAIDPKLARYMSSYGHSFDQPPGVEHRLSELSGMVRPPWMRRLSHPLKNRLNLTTDDHGGLLSPEFLGRVIDLSYPAMRRYFRMDRLRDPGMRRRIANLEYLATWLGAKLATP